MFDTVDLPSRPDSGRCLVPNTRRHFYTFADRQLQTEQKEGGVNTQHNLTHTNLSNLKLTQESENTACNITCGVFGVYSRMLHLFPLHPDAQEHVLGPTHFPLFMHVGSHTPGAHLFTCLFDELRASVSN